MNFYEKVNPAHPDKIADRIAGALGDLYYKKDKDAKFAIEVLLGHNNCLIISEASKKIDFSSVKKIVNKITKRDDFYIKFKQVPQDKELSKNQKSEAKCGDNGIFKSVYYSEKEKTLIKKTVNICNDYYIKSNKKDGKVIGVYDKDNNFNFTVCQSNYNDKKDNNIYLNPLGAWTGGLDVDSGATNRKLGSDMGESATGGGLHGKDLSKADVSVNIYLHLLSSKLKKSLQAMCSIGDKNVKIYNFNYELVEDVPFEKIVEKAKNYIENLGGFENFARWGLIRPNIQKQFISPREELEDELKCLKKI